ncbi:MAG: glycerate kinase [Rhodobacteraceae bacterium]|nr:MAG: glycerate kinase [Paracoccaceae bacterium]
MRERAVKLFDAAVKAADPATALRPHLTGLPTITGRYVLISIGKAACAMIEEAIANLPSGASFKAIAVTNYENARDIENCTVMAAGHPVPDENGHAAGRAVIDLLQTATSNDVVLALISGGGSALLPAPINGVSLADKAEVSRILLGAGVDITEMNMVRQQLSRLKGGGMARLARPANLHGYILSDVIGDDLRVIASGPTVAPIASRSAARDLLTNLNVFDQMPASVQNALKVNEPETAPINAENTLIGSNGHSLRAMLAASDGGVIITDSLTGDVADAAEYILQSALNNPSKTLIFGGETTVTIRGDGKGGRNQELALRVAMLAEKADLGDWLFLSGGTDGRDGPTDAAGGIVDKHTVQRIRDAGENPEALLANNDSYAALQAAQDLLMTGATGTNVADVQVFLRPTKG